MFSNAYVPKHTSVCVCVCVRVCVCVCVRVFTGFDVCASSVIGYIQTHGE